MCAFAVIFIIIGIIYAFISKILELISGPVQFDSSQSSTNTEALQKDFIACLFSLLTKLSMADGEISQNEADAINSLAKSLFTGVKRDFIRNVITKVRNEKRPVEFYLKHYGKSWGHTFEVVQIMMESLCIVATADGKLTNSEMEMLLTIENFFGFNGFVRAYIQNAHNRGKYNPNSSSEYGNRGNSYQWNNSSNYSYSSRNQQNNQNSKRSSHFTQNIDDYYRVLGCTPKDDNDTVKSAYRNLCKKYHPDVLQSKGLPPELLAKASEKMQAINDAYQHIKESRGL